MRINNNMMAMNTHRQLGVANEGGAKSMEKLSSGLRINRAGDDAAGLSISEKMRGQIRGLNQASSNAQDGISMIQTAEGALNETHAILQRMRELAVQSATDTNTNDDRAKIQGEVDQLAKEITRISNTTEFNTQNMLNGGKDASVSNASGAVRFHIGSNQGQHVDLGIGAMDAQALGIADTNMKALDTANGIKSVSFNGDRGDAIVDGASITVTAAVAGGVVGSHAAGGNIGISLATDTNTDELNGVTVTYINGGDSANASETAIYDANSKTLTVTLDADDTGSSGMSTLLDVQSKMNTALSDAGFKTTVTLGGAITDVGDPATGANDSDSIAIGSGTWDTATFTVTDGTKTNNAQTSLANVDSFTFKDTDFKGIKIEFDKPITAATTTKIVINDSTSASFNADGSLNVEASTSKGIDVSTQRAADSAVTKINDAIETVSAERSKLGAMQNRLEHTIKNLDTSSENLQASEARIRDVDMAKEMMEQTKQNILAQASTAMLANANQAPQAVLQLLR